MSTKLKNKHGRTGVKKYHPRRPLTEEQSAAARLRGKEEGYKLGRRVEKAEALIFLNNLTSCRNIREVKRRIEEYRNAQA
jgi:hypothetical protein